MRQYDRHSDVVNYINTLSGYRGYVQFSHRPLEIAEGADLFRESDPHIEESEGFVLEAHFSDGKRSIAVRQVNDGWIVSETPLENAQVVRYEGIAGIGVKMAQIWGTQPDALCEGMPAQRLEAVVFAGFEGGEA